MRLLTGRDNNRCWKLSPNPWPAPRSRHANRRNWNCGSDRCNSWKRNRKRRTSLHDPQWHSHICYYRWCKSHHKRAGHCRCKCAAYWLELYAPSSIDYIDTYLHSNSNPSRCGITKFDIHHNLSSHSNSLTNAYLCTSAQRRTNHRNIPSGLSWRNDVNHFCNTQRLHRRWFNISHRVRDFWRGRRRHL